VIELGGNITLNGFQDRDYAELIVVKKIVGRYARQITDTHPTFERLKVCLNVLPHADGSTKHTVQVSCVLKGTPIDAEASDRNLFIALDSGLKELVERLA
jgi:hypothetical protein